MPAPKVRLIWMAGLLPRGTAADKRSARDCSRASLSYAASANTWATSPHRGAPPHPHLPWDTGQRSAVIRPRYATSAAEVVSNAAHKSANSRRCSRRLVRR